MLVKKFTIKDLNIPKGYEFLTKELGYETFYIEVNEDEYNNNPNANIDTIWEIGVYGYTKRSCRYWLEILDLLIDTKGLNDEEYDKYTDFKTVFEDACVVVAEEFEKELLNK